VSNPEPCTITIQPIQLPLPQLTLVILVSLQAGIAMPSALGGMLGLSGLLMLFGPRAGGEMVHFYDTHLAWTSQLLPLFYVPALAVLPVLMHGMPGGYYLRSSVLAIVYFPVSIC
jgi:hypothetical protein